MEMRHTLLVLFSQYKTRFKAYQHIALYNRPQCNQECGGMEVLFAHVARFEEAK